MHKNRRNYYRILQTQPDASREVIKNNYRTLLQKLKIHPDLGGENWNASLINQAYNTLRNPSRRAAYDKELLRQYKIATLSRGQFNRLSTRQYISSRGKLPASEGNKRNYYRVLHIQPDSPAAIIESSYRALLNNPNTPKTLLKEAYSTLANPADRSLYDHLLANHCHMEIITMQKGRDKKNSYPLAANTRHGHYSSSRGKPPGKSGYQPLIRNYCAFCKTPCSHSPCAVNTQFCTECGSPLTPTQQRLIKQPHRNLERLLRDGGVNIFTCWPGQCTKAEISDISPAGMRFSFQGNIDNGQIVKIDGDDFKAVGEVMYNQSKAEQVIAGIRFITVHFNRQKGHFLAVSA